MNNQVILIVSFVTALVLGFLVWKVFRSVWASLCLIVAVVGLVWLSLPESVSNVGSRDDRQRPIDGRSPALGGSTGDASQVTLEQLEPFRPIELPTHDYVGAEACKSCHQENHATWFASYHRSMTQIASPAAIIGDFDDKQIDVQGATYHLNRSGELCVVDMPDVESAVPEARIRGAIVMATGSHHMQLYWFATGQKRMLAMFPLAFLRETEEWIPRGAAFLRPPGLGDSFEMGRWNAKCSICHSTHRKPRITTDQQWDTHVAEFGISCEACHGPGRAHIAYRQQNELASKDRSDPIVDPQSLAKQLSADVCGQCHSVNGFSRHSDLANLNGHGYVPGARLADSTVVLTSQSPEFVEEHKKQNYPDLNTLLDELYYRDGMIRVAGREYNGLIESACFEKGEMTCLSCHQMHQSDTDTRTLAQWADDQLKPEALSDQACVQCHAGDRYGQIHTHHAVGSSGSSCYNCHMPHTTYGLLKAIRSHTISSPNVADDRAAKRPNACNLCHLDKTLAWSAEHLKAWYGFETPEFDEQEQTIAASLLWLIRGNAATRALAAWSMGWDVAQKSSGNDWQAPFLAYLMDDEYPAIRLIARRSLRSLPGFEQIQTDVVTSSTSADRMEMIETVWQTWFRDLKSQAIERPELLIEASRPQVERLDELLEQRDTTPMSLAE